MLEKERGAGSAAEVRAAVSRREMAWLPCGAWCFQKPSGCGVEISEAAVKQPNPPWPVPACPQPFAEAGPRRPAGRGERTALCVIINSELSPRQPQTSEIFCWSTGNGAALLFSWCAAANSVLESHLSSCPLLCCQPDVRKNRRLPPQCCFRVSFKYLPY